MNSESIFQIQQGALSTISIRPMTEHEQKLASKFSSPKECFNNCFRFVQLASGYEYCLGTFADFIEHAWIRTPTGEFIDPTLELQKSKLNGEYKLLHCFSSDEMFNFLNKQLMNNQSAYPPTIPLLRSSKIYAYLFSSYIDSNHAA